MPLKGEAPVHSYRSPSLSRNTADKLLPVTRANFLRRNSRNNKIYAKQVASVIENCKRKSNNAKGKFKTFQTQSLLNYGILLIYHFVKRLPEKKLHMFKTLVHVADLLSFGAMNSSGTANLAG